MIELSDFANLKEKFMAKVGRIGSQIGYCSRSSRS